MLDRLVVLRHMLSTGCIHPECERKDGKLKTMDYFPFLFIDVGTNDSAWHSLQHIKSNYVAQEKKGEAPGSAGCILPDLPDEG